MLKFFVQSINDMKVDLWILFMLKRDQTWDFFWTLKDKVFSAIHNAELESSSSDSSEKEEITFE